MTPIEELQYLANLTYEACKWRIAEGDTRSGLEMEVEERLKNLNELIAPKAKGINVEGVPSDKVGKSNDKDYEYKAKWAEGRCRIGNKWHLKSECVKVPRKDGIGWKWALKSEVTDVSSEERN